MFVDEGDETMEFAKTSRKTFAVIVSAVMLVTATAFAVGTGAFTSNAPSASAAQPAKAATVISYETSDGMPYGVKTDGVTTRVLASKSSTEANEDFELLINPGVANVASKPGISGMVVDFDPDGTGENIMTVSLDAKVLENGSKDTNTWPIVNYTEDEESRTATAEQKKNSDGTWASIPKDDIKYDVNTGVLTINAKYQSYAGITVYNYLSKGQRNTKHTVYGAYTLDGESKSIPNANKLELVNDSLYGTLTAYKLGDNFSGSDPEYNAIQHQLPVYGGGKLWAGYTPKSVMLFAAVTRNGVITDTFPLVENVDYTVNYSLGTIALSSDINADVIVIKSAAETKDGLIQPRLSKKEPTSLTYNAVAGYTYKLYDKDKKLIATKTTKDNVTSAGTIVFSGLDSDTRYFIQAVSPTGQETTLRKVKTPEETKPFDFGFKKGDEFYADVYVGNHYTGFTDVEGVSASFGNTVFYCNITNVHSDGSARDEALKAYFEGKDFLGNCCSPGKGYSTGNTKTAYCRVLWADTNTRTAKISIEMSGAWYANGRQIQNVAGNVTIPSVPVGEVEIQKTSTDPQSLDNPYYDFEGIEYTLIGATYGKEYTITLDEKGYGKVGNVMYDDYEVYESSTNDVYQLDEDTYEVSVNEETTKKSTVPARVKNNENGDELHDIPVYVYLDLDKASSNPSITDHNDLYDVRGTKYQIFPGDNTKFPAGAGADYGIMTTDGTKNFASAKSQKLLIGNYTVKEIDDAPSYSVDPTTYVIPASKFSGFENDQSYHIVPADAEGGTPKVDPASATALGENPDVDFSFKIQKTDDLNSSKVGEGKANLSAVFEIRYYNTLDSNYDSNNPFDTWYVRTDKNGYADLDFIKDNPVVSGERIEQGMKDPYSYAQNPNNGGRFYTKKAADGTEHVVMPVGYVEIQEVVAPYGYLYDTGSPFGPGKTYKYLNNELVLSEGQHVVDGAYDTNRAEENNFQGVPEHAYRSDFQLLKRDENSNPLALIPFVVESKTTGEKHLIVTDQNGYYTSESYIIASDDRREGYPHNRNTNYNDQFLAYDENGTPYITDESKLRYDVGTFFSGYGPKSEEDHSGDIVSDLKDGKLEREGALPYDDYILSEVRCSNNEGLGLKVREFSVEKHNVLAATFDIEDPLVRIHTNATDFNTNSHAGLITGNTVTIKDEVSYEGLNANTEYTMVGTLMDKATGAPLLDENGKAFVVKQPFTTPENDTQGTVTLTFEVPASVMAAKTTVVFESCQFNGEEVGVHADIEDEGQTVSYPSVHTTATDSKTGDHEGNLTADETTTVVDAVKCGGLQPGKTYQISGTLMDRATNAPLKGEDGATFTAKAEFTAEAVEQTVELRFDVPTKVIAGKTVVAFEDLYQNNVLIGTHSDINDEEQTVYYPALRTTATDSVTKDHEGLAKDTITINDLVEYENLIKGDTYTISGKVMDKATGEVLKGADGKDVTATATFVAGEDATVAEAQELVDVYLEVAKKVLGIYENMTDDEKSDFMEKIDGTELPEFPTYDEMKSIIDQAAKEGTSVLDEHKAMLVNFDKFYLSLSDEQKKETTELVSVDKLYGAIGTVSAAADKEASNEGTAPGKPERVSGSVIVSFDIPADAVRGKTTVVFEDLYTGTEPGDNNHKATHSDINDEGQTVVYPEIHTLAHAVDDVDSHMAYISFEDSTCHFVDTITYKNLVPGHTYRADGTLMDPETGQPYDCGTGIVTAQTVFTPETPDGSVDVEFVFDATVLSEELKANAPILGYDEFGDPIIDIDNSFRKFVVFEEVYLTNTDDSGVADELIAEHKDLNDADQTIQLANAPLDYPLDDAELPQAGDIVLYALMTIAFLSGCYAFAYRHRKRNLFE